MQAEQVRCDQKPLNETCSTAFLNRVSEVRILPGALKSLLALEICAVSEGSMTEPLAILIGDSQRDWEGRGKGAPRVRD